jgi:hypothetical protein
MVASERAFDVVGLIGFSAPSTFLSIRRFHRSRLAVSHSLPTKCIQLLCSLSFSVSLSISSSCSSWRLYRFCVRLNGGFGACIRLGGEKKERERELSREKTRKKRERTNNNTSCKHVQVRESERNIERERSKRDRACSSSC